MSASHEWQEYHLTPSGWVQGNAKWDFQEVEERPVPADRVLTRRRTEHLSSSFSKLQRDTSDVWTGTDQKKIEELLAKFGPGPAGEQN